MTHMPDLTILTPCKNPGRNLVRTLQSVNSLTEYGINIQHIILCSESGSMERFIPNCESDWRTIITASDTGPYDALNLGARLAKGRYVQVLNVGDIIVSPWYLSDIAAQSCEVLSFGAYDEYAANLRNLTTFQDLRLDSVGRHEAILVRRDVLLRAPFDMSLPVKADRDQMMAIGALCYIFFLFV